MANEEMKNDKADNWWDGFDERQLRLIRNCERYAGGDPGGLPGHQLMLIVAKMAGLLWRMSAGKGTVPVGEPKPD